jgi:RNA polymerase sigma factor (sigma-70 family)
MGARHWTPAVALKSDLFMDKKEEESLKQLFQQEFSKMVAVIGKIFGLAHIELAEDLVSETFLQAAETWGVKGMPPNPTAWLYVVAKQKTLHYFRRNKVFEQKIVPALRAGRGKDQVMDEPDFSEQGIRDSQLQMLFAICTPAIASEAQIGLALRILCGFGIDEIAEAFLSNKETINKRLFRAKEKLRQEKVTMEMPAKRELEGRLGNVMHIIYLLFSEGYYSRTNNQILRKELCYEALRLGLLLTQYEITNQPKTNALVALMCFHASRFGARKTEDDTLVLYEQQDATLWDKDLIDRGWHFMDLSASGDEVSSYHLEARIASWHSIQEDTAEKWANILQLYDRLLALNYSPSVALHRIFALYKAQGPQVALAEAEALGLENNYFYFILLGELYKETDADQSRRNLERAYALAKTEAERQIIREKILSIG